MSEEREHDFWADDDDPNRVHAMWTHPSDFPDLPTHDAGDGALLLLPGRSHAQEHLLRIERRVQSGLDVVAVFAIEVEGMDAAGSGDLRAVVRDRLKLIRGAHVYDGDDGCLVLIVEWMRSRFEAMCVAERIHRRLQEPCTVGNELVPLRARIGVRVSLDGAQHPATFVQDADRALEAACRRGPGSTALWAPAGRVLVTGRGSAA